jgi:two-component system cell cycle sensor histidine kinase/response regulator CckA
MSEHILVVDDDELVRTGMATNLERSGFRVTMAASGEEGIRLALQQHMDLVLCDLVLGDVDGIDVLRRIKAQSPATSVVMITGHGSIKNALDALRSGASDYIQKPADPEEVEHRLRTVLDSVHLRNTLSAERHRTELRKRETNEQLIRAERMSSLGTLAAGAAQDLTEILAPVSRHAGPLREALPAGHPALEWVGEIEEAGLKASAILHDLQAIGQGREHETSEVNINHVVDHYMKSDDYQALKKRHPKVRVDIELAPMLPPVQGEAGPLGLLLGHLVTHACESMPGGGLVNIYTTSGHIDRPVGRYGCGQPGDYVSLRVSDSGPGLKAEDVERIFEPFYVRAVLGHRTLSGLGMTLVYRVVEDHRGYIDVTTRTGQGTSFTACFPVATAGGATLELKADYTGRETILVVDDYEEQRNTAAELLRDLGYQVFTASNGREAVKLFESAMRAGDQPMDVVVLDLVLGDDFDGVETYKSIIALKPGQKAVLVSGFADIARIVEARKLGLRQCIPKPYSLDTLGKAVRSELDG